MELLQLEFVWVLLDGRDPSAGEIFLEADWSMVGSPRLNIQVSGTGKTHHKNGAFGL